MKGILKIFGKSEKEKTEKSEKSEKSEKVERIDKYESLSPSILHTDKISTYLEALNEALSKKENKNIAITGAYGSGKSSILRTFQAQNPDNKYLNISLANFKVDSVDDMENTNFSSNEENNLNRLLELSILQQIFYHVEKNEIPDSRFRRINLLSTTKIFWFVIFSIVWLISFFFLFQFELISNWFPKLTQSIILNILMLSLFVLGLGFALANLRRTLNNSKINKFNVQSGDFEIDKDIDRSILNKHLDEIIYFFQATEYRIVIIEDLDRFENTEIFSKLREINLLLNNSEQISKSKKPIVFIYAIRDDMFKDKDRVKFFDFIIPVIPIINPSNSSDILLKKLELLKDNKPSSELISGISYYIDDMRLLKNIWNEYLTYRSILKDSLSQDKLFSLITYKNFYPDDFVALNINESEISKIFEKREVFEAKFINKKDAEIEVLRAELDELERQRIVEGDELRKIYLATINEVYPNSIAFAIGNNLYEFKSLVEASNFEKLQESTSVVRVYYDAIRPNGSKQYYSNVRSEIINIDFELIENKVNEKVTFDNRLKLINRNYSYKDKITSQINFLIQEKKAIKNYNLKQLLTELDAKDILSEYEQNKLLIYCVTNGYIDKYYSEYISYFHGVSLSSDDFEYLIALRSGVAFDFNYQLTSIANLAQKVEPKYYQQKAILNYNLFDYWFSSSKFQIQQDAVIRYLSLESKVSLNFIKGIPEHLTTIDKFSNRVIKIWEGFWKHLEENSLYTNDIKESFFKSMIINGELNEIKKQSQMSSLKSYIANSNSFLNSFSSKKYHKKLENVIDCLSIEFENLLPNENILLEYIYDTNRYTLTSNNLKTILDLKSQNISLSYFDIFNSELKQLNEYIEVAIDDYVENILLLENRVNKEHQEGIILLLNHQGLSEENKRLIIDHLKDRQIDLVEVNNTKSIDHLILSFKALPTWQNTLDYFENSNNIINEKLIKYLNEPKIYNVLAETYLKDSIPEKARRFEFVKQLINTNDLKLKSYSTILLKCRFIFNEIILNDISEDKVNWLVENKFAKATKVNFDFLKSTYPMEHIHLMEICITDFLNDIEVYELDDSDILVLLKSENLSLKNKITLFEKQVDYSLIIRTDGLGEVLSSILVKAGKKTNVEILMSLFDTTKSIEIRVKLLNINFRDLARNDVYDLLNKMTNPYNKIAMEHKRPLLPKTEYNEDLVRNLENRDLISSFKHTAKGIRVIAKNSI